MLISACILSFSTYLAVCPAYNSHVVLYVWHSCTQEFERVFDHFGLGNENFSLLSWRLLFTQQVLRNCIRVELPILLLSDNLIMISIVIWNGIAQVLPRRSVLLLPWAHVFPGRGLRWLMQTGSAASYTSISRWWLCISLRYFYFKWVLFKCVIICGVTPVESIWDFDISRTNLNRYWSNFSSASRCHFENACCVIS